MNKDSGHVHSRERCNEREFSLLLKVQGVETKTGHKEGTEKIIG